MVNRLLTLQGLKKNIIKKKFFVKGNISKLSLKHSGTANNKKMHFLQEWEDKDLGQNTEN